MISFKLLVIAGALTLVRADSLPTQPMGGIGNHQWDLDETLSYGPKNNYFSPFKLIKGFEGWIGSPPAPHSDRNAKVKNGKIELMLRANDDQFDFEAAANDANLAACECDAPYGPQTSSLVRLSKKVQFGYIDIEANVPAGNLYFSIWLQGQQTEISAVKIHGNGNSIESAGYTFDDEATLTSQEKTKTGVFTAGQTVRFGIEWRLNHDVRIYQNGVFVQVLKGTTWNPEGIIEPMDLIIDIAGDAEANTPETTNKVARVSYVAVFKLNCGVLNTHDTTIKTGSNSPQINSTQQATQPYASHCSVRDLGSNAKGDFSVAVNPFAQFTKLTSLSAQEDYCNRISLGQWCGGWKDKTLPGGSNGLCYWDTKASLCVARVDCSGFSGEDCGGNTDFDNGGSQGQCMQCFGQCVQKPKNGLCHNYCGTIIGNDQQTCIGNEAKSSCRWVASKDSCKARAVGCWRLKQESSCETEEGKCYWDSENKKCLKEICKKNDITRFQCNKLSRCQYDDASSSCDFIECDKIKDQNECLTGKDDKCYWNDRIGACRLNQAWTSN